MPAHRTLNVRGISATIQKQNHLPPLAQGCLDRLVHLPRNRTAGAIAAEFVSQIDRAHRRQRPIEHPPRHFDQAIIALLRPIPAFQRRRGRGQNQWNLLFARPPKSHVAGVISRIAILFECALVFFIEHNQTQLRHRRKYRAASANHHLHFAAGDSLPMPVALRVAQMTVQHRHPIEPGAKAFLGLGGEADFRHQHDRLPAIAHRLLNGLNVNLSFATAGHTVNENGFVPRGAERLQNCFQSSPLIIIQLKRQLPRNAWLAARFGANPFCCRRENSFAPQCGNWARCAAGGAGQLTDLDRL